MLSIVSRSQSSSGEGKLVPEEALREPLFYIEYAGRLKLNTHGWSGKAKSYYAHAIARSPSTLWLHVQRINLLIDLNDRDLFGALLDLFIALKEHGTALRQRMLALAKPKLNAEQFQELLNGITNPQQFNPGFATGSKLASGIRSNMQIIATARQQQDSAEDPLQMAEQLLAYGQVDQAQETLETAIRYCSERVDLHHALLEIYRHRQDNEQILRFWNEIKSKNCPAEADWQDLIDQLKVKWKDHE
ncbi:MAG: hypothetical protein ABW170_08465 [Candidatus Thiodiazotropha sp. L084R]